MPKRYTYGRQYNANIVREKIRSDRTQSTGNTKNYQNKRFTTNSRFSDGKNLRSKLDEAVLQPNPFFWSNMPPRPYKTTQSWWSDVSRRPSQLNQNEWKSTSPKHKTTNLSGRFSYGMKDSQFSDQIQPSLGRFSQRMKDSQFSDGVKPSWYRGSTVENFPRRFKTNICKACGGVKPSSRNVLNTQSWNSDETLIFSSTSTSMSSLSTLSSSLDLSTLSSLTLTSSSFTTLSSPSSLSTLSSSLSSPTLPTLASKTISAKTTKSASSSSATL